MRFFRGRPPQRELATLRPGGDADEPNGGRIRKILFRKGASDKPLEAVLQQPRKLQTWSFTFLALARLVFREVGPKSFHQLAHPSDEVGSLHGFERPRGKVVGLKMKDAIPTPAERLDIRRGQERVNPGINQLQIPEALNNDFQRSNSDNSSTGPPHFGAATRPTVPSIIVRNFLAWVSAPRGLDAGAVHHRAQTQFACPTRVGSMSIWFFPS